MLTFGVQCCGVIGHVDKSINNPGQQAQKHNNIMLIIMLVL